MKHDGARMTPQESGPAVRPVDDAMRSSGRPLGAAIRTDMERHVGHHLESIRIHGPGSGAGQGGAAEAEADRIAARSAPSSPATGDPRASRPSVASSVDFRHVRLHTGPEASTSAQLMGAEAYAAGSHVVLDDRRAPLQSPEGRRTLAHELVHVVQQVGPRRSDDARSTPWPRGSSVAMKAAYPRVHEHVLKRLIAIARQHPEDGSDRVEPLRELANSVPGSDRSLLVERLNKPPRQDAFTDYLRINFPSTRSVFLAALGAKQTAEAAAPTTPSRGFAALNRARRDPKYIDNGIAKIRTDGLRAEIFYRDGAKLDLGLVPETIASPFQGVDYRTSRGEIGTLDPTTPGTIRILPHQRKLVSPKASYGEFLQTAEKRAREVQFVVESASGRLVPTEVNSLTAPLLCATFRKADEENEALAEATSEGGVKVFTMVRHVLELYAFLTPTKAMRPMTAGTQAVPRAAAAFARMRSALARALGEAAAKGAVIDEIVVEGVSLGALKALREGGTLTVRYAFIQRVGAVAGRGRMAQWALEEAAKDVARAQGATLARVWVEAPIQARWLAYLESVGYSWSAETLPAGMVKVLPL